MQRRYAEKEAKEYDGFHGRFKLVDLDKMTGKHYWLRTPISEARRSSNVPETWMSFLCTPEMVSWYSPPMTVAPQPLVTVLPSGAAAVNSKVQVRVIS